MPIMFLTCLFFICAVASFLLCAIARKLFPKFRSGEHKEGTHRPDQPAGGREIKTIELPLVGGPALTLALVGTGILAGYLLDFTSEQWRLLLIALGATVGYMIVGFIDDWHKFHSNEGISERAKFIGVFLVSIAAALFYFFLLPGGRESYSPYKDLPFINTLLCTSHIRPEEPTCPVMYGQIAYYGWLVFLLLMTGVIGSVTSLSVDFSDGLDGLAGGLVFSSALAFGIIVLGLIGTASSGLVLEVLSLLCAASVLGYLPWNWPSAWAARRGTAKRRARIYMGDSGALGLGGILAMIAIFSRQEILLLLVGAAFVLEGLSALISARLLTRFFRKYLQVVRFVSSREFVPHTEFPLPFLATPLHHHFDLLGWNRCRLVYGAWALGAIFAILGVMSTIAHETWQRYFLRILLLILAWVIWSSGSWSKLYFVGKHPAERPRRRRLALYYGYPYRLMGINLYHLVEIIEASEDIIETPAEEIALWQRMNIFDARAMLGLYCYRAGYFPAALTQWQRIPERNRILRPEINRMLEELNSRLALEKQETQPMRRDQIVRELTLLSGNLPPADLPNPHEPVRSEETADGHVGDWTRLQASAYPLNSDGEERRRTLPLRGDATPEANGHRNSRLAGYLEQGQSSSDAQHTDSSTTVREHWLLRLLRFSSQE